MRNSKSFIHDICGGRDFLHPVLAFYAAGNVAGILKTHCPADKSYEMC